MLILNHIGETYFGGYRHDIEHLRSLFTPNMLTHAHMASLSLDSLLKNKGRIVVVSSAVGTSFVVYALNIIKFSTPLVVTQMVKINGN